MARNYRQGYYEPVNPKKYVSDGTAPLYRSSWEKRFMYWCDMNSSVVKWSSETVVIPYFSRADNKNRRYFLDFIVMLRTTTGELKSLLIEIKPDAQTRKPKAGKRKKESTLMEETHTYMVNQDKWAAATEYAKNNGMEFIVLTEKDLFNK